MANRIAVRVEDLERFASQIDRVRNELSGALDHVDGAAFGLQSPIVLDALRDFSDAWSDRRRSLLDDIQDAADVLRNAAVNFESLDSQLAEGLGGGPGGDGQ